MKLWIKSLLFLAMLIVPADYSLAEEVSTPTINTEALSVKNQNFSKASTGRKYALTGDYPVYLRNERSEYAQIHRIIPEYSALLVLDEQEKWYRVRFFDEEKQLEGWIPDSNAMLYIEEHDGDIKQGAYEIRRRISEQEEKRRMQRIDALKIKKREISDLDYKGKLDVCEELSRIDVKNKNQYQLEADIYRDKITLQEEQVKAKQEEQAKAKQKKQEEQSKKERPYNLMKNNPSWSSEDIQTILAGKVRIGMNMEQCKEAWGRPSRINNTTFAYGTHSQWCYGDYCSNALYFENGILTAIQN